MTVVLGVVGAWLLAALALSLVLGAALRWGGAAEDDLARSSEGPHSTRREVARRRRVARRRPHRATTG